MQSTSGGRTVTQTNACRSVNPSIHHLAVQPLQPWRDNAASESIHLTVEPHLSSKLCRCSQSARRRRRRWWSCALDCSPGGRLSVTMLALSTFTTNVLLSRLSTTLQRCSCIKALCHSRCQPQLMRNAQQQHQQSI